jgi:predicted enzyme related to lactoylglutathione lyase
MSTASPASTVGKFVWYEWMGEDVKAAITFYGHVVGWNAKDSGMPGMDYTIVSVGDYGVGGMMTIPEEAKAMGAPPCWTGYVWVDDVDAAAAKLTAGGGSVKRPGSDIPGVGRFAVVTDPQGAHFILFRDAGGNPPPLAPASSAGANCTPTTAPRRSTSMQVSSAGQSAAPWIWARWASTSSSPSPAGTTTTAA